MCVNWFRFAVCCSLFADAEMKMDGCERFIVQFTHLHQFQSIGVSHSTSSAGEREWMWLISTDDRDTDSVNTYKLKLKRECSWLWLIWWIARARVCVLLSTSTYTMYAVAFSLIYSLQIRNERAKKKFVDLFLFSTNRAQPILAGCFCFLWRTDGPLLFGKY